MQSNLFIFQNESPILDLGGGVSRQILGYNQNMMMVKVNFLKGAIGALHTHEHTQTSYCSEGAFEFTIGKETRVIQKGDATYIPPGVLHGVVCMQEGVLIDTFNPVREDFL
ncbi:MAG: cupin domain-containing protein [Prolixibacteraceae bacterium]